MKRLLYLFLIALTGISWAGCQDITTEDTSVITYYITFDMEGDETMLVPLGTAYVDPGVTAYEGETDVTSTMTVTGTVDSDEVGIYPVTYSAINKDGFPSSMTRTVVVYDPAVTTDLSGTYTTNADTYRLYYSTSAKVYYPGFSVKIDLLAPGVFYVSDYFAGYYDQRAAYGASYAMTGYMKLNTDNTIGLISSSVKGWGDSLNFLDNAKFDPDKGQLYWEAGYAGAMTFYVTLK